MQSLPNFKPHSFFDWNGKYQVALAIALLNDDDKRDVVVVTTSSLKHL